MVRAAMMRHYWRGIALGVALSLGCYGAGFALGWIGTPVASDMSDLAVPCYRQEWDGHQSIVDPCPLPTTEPARSPAQPDARGWEAYWKSVPRPELRKHEP